MSTNLPLRVNVIIGISKDKKLASDCENAQLVDDLLNVVHFIFERSSYNKVYNLLFSIIKLEILPLDNEGHSSQVSSRLDSEAW